MSRDDPGRAAAQAQTQAQLDALDRIVAREPVGEEHLELAALVESVQADAPRMDPAFAQRLDERIAERVARRRRRVRPALGLHRVALASGGIVAAAVAFAIVISSGILDGGGGGAPGRATGAGNTAATHVPAAVSRTRQTHAKLPAAAVGTHTSAAPFGAAGTAPTPTNAAAGSTARLVHRSSSLVLATPATTLSNVAGRVVALTERDGGVVASSYVDAHDAASRASFSLRLPSRRLPALIAGLSALAQVRSLSQNTTDVTSGYGHVHAALSARRTERAQLNRRLRAAETTGNAAAQRALKRRIAALSALIARDVREASSYLGESRTASLHVDVVVGATPKAGAHGHHGGGGTLDRASRTALHALEELLALALVALAIALPLGLCALALWWAAASVRQRARERAIRAA